MHRGIIVLVLGVLAAVVGAGEEPWRLSPRLGPHEVQLEVAGDELEVRTRPGAALATAPSVRGLVTARIAASAIDGRADRQDRALHLPARLAPAALRTLAAQVAGESAGEVLAVAYPPGRHGEPALRLVLTRQATVAVLPGTDVVALARRVGAVVVRSLAPVPNVHLLAAVDQDLLAGPALADRLRRQAGVTWAEAEIERRSQLRHTPDDPLFAQQWHLLNTGQLGAGPDIDVVPVWDTYRGAGVLIGFIDDGVQYTHPDLVTNYRQDIDIDLRSGDSDAAPGASDFHGTCVAGLAAARGDNTSGVTGVAYEAGMVGIRLIGGSFGPSTEATALAYLSNPVDPSQRLHIISNSWGDVDDGRFVASLESAPSAAIDTAITIGRGRRGVVYTWAAGNGGWDDGDPTNDWDNLDNANYDRYLDRRVIPVGAIDPQGLKAWYSEAGSNLHVCAPGGSDGGNGIVTTDRTGSAGYAAGTADYTAASDNLEGTSFSAPIAAGAIALVLQAKPTLTWRDVQHVLALTAAKNDSGAAWQVNAAGYHFCNDYGFGLIDTAAAVNKALTWGNVPAYATPLTASTSTSLAIPDNNVAGVTWSPSITAPAGFRAECVELAVSILHPRRGDLQFTITSPAGTVATIPRRPYDGTANLAFTFTARTCWGELAAGTWTVTVADLASGQTGTVSALGLRIHGFVPPGTPAISAISPTGFSTGSADQVVTITGSGFAADSSGASLSVVWWNGIALATTFVNATHLTAIVPAAQLAASGSATFTVQNPSVELASGTLGGGTSGGIPVSIQPGPTITAIADQSIPRDGATTALPFTIADPDTPIASLTVTATSSNPALVANAACVLAGTGASRTITVTPTAGASGIAVISVTVSDGNSSATAAFQLTVVAPPSSSGGGGGGGCGSGGLFGLGLLLLAGCWLRPRRRRS